MKKTLSEILDISFESINGLLDSKKIVGEMIKVDEETTIIPLTRLTYGLGSGGSEFKLGNEKEKDNNLFFESANEPYPFGGGTLLGINMTPEAFLVIQKGNVKMIKNNEKNDIYKTLIEFLQNTLKMRK